MNTTESTDTGNTIKDWWNAASNEIEEQIDEAIGDVARAIGIHDFYSAHVLDYCEGFFTPAAVPNDTVSKGDISRNVTYCSNTTSMHHFNPREQLETELANNKFDIDLSKLSWPEEIDDGLNALKVAQAAMFVLYCVAIVMIAIAFLAAIAGLFFNDHRLSSFVNLTIDLIALLCIGIASAIVTAIAVKASDLINHYGNDIGVSATSGKKFLALTWVATVCMFLCCLAWCFDCCVGKKGHKARRGFGEKNNGYRSGSS